MYEFTNTVSISNKCNNNDILCALCVCIVQPFQHQIQVVFRRKTLQHYSQAKA